MDSSQEAVQLMENGVFKGLVVQKAFKMGYMGVKETVRMLRGKSYDKDVNSGCELVTPDNMYSSEIEKRKYLTFFWKIFHYNCAQLTVLYRKREICVNF